MAQGSGGGSLAWHRWVLPALERGHGQGQLLCTPEGSRMFTPLNIPGLQEQQGWIDPSLTIHPPQVSITPV